MKIIEANGGSPPLTFSMFNHVTSALGKPERPLEDVDLSSTKLVKGLDKELAEKIQLFEGNIVTRCDQV